MADTQKPIIFLAFANPKKDLDEDLEIKLFQELFNQESQFEYKFIFAADAKAIYDFFKSPQHRGRICIFHYSGHANKKYVLLSDKLTHGETLGSFLALQVGLQLVVLNACETQSLGDLIVEKGIPAVIATNQPVKDLKAARFSRNFYENLLSGNTIDIAFQNATSGIESVSESLSLVRSLNTEEGIQKEVEYLSLYNQETDKDWTLSETLDDPYFGLPKLPPTAYDNLPDVPFIGLEPYGKTTAPLFFGRAASIRELMVGMKDPYRKLILLYGKSGVGKSSLLAAGIEGRLKQDGYSSIYFSRSSNGLLTTLAEALQCTDGDYQRAWIELENSKDRPLIVILDQAEEAITSHKPEEIETLAKAIISIFNIAKRDEYTGESQPSPIRGKLILGYREEFHGQIENVFRQKNIPTEKILIEPLNPDSIREVVEGIPKDPRLLRKYKFTVPPAVTERIQAKLSEDTTDAISPVLQLLLTNMWEKSSPAVTGEREFTAITLDALLREGIWLKDFVQQQLDKVEKSYPAQVKSGLVLDMLHYLTTDLGTARAIPKLSILARYDRGEGTLTELLKILNDLYVVAKTTINEEETYRLSHDTLAPIVRKMYAESILPGQVASRLLAGKNIDAKNTFSESDISILEDGKPGMANWNAKQVVAFDESQAFLKQQRASSENRQLVNQFIKLSERANDKTLAFQAAYSAWKLEPDNDVATRLLQENWDKPAYLQELLSSSVVSSCDISDDADLAMASGNIIKIFKWQSQVPPIVLAGHKDETYSVTFSNDGKFVASGGDDKTVKVWTCKSNVLYRTLEGHDEGISYLTFSSDGNLIVSRSRDNSVKIWDWKNSTLLRTLKVPGRSRGAAISPDGRLVAVGSGDNNIQVWNWGNQDLIYEFAGQEEIMSLDFSNDSLLLASCNLKGTVSIWELQTRKLNCELKIHNGAIFDVAFSPDGKYVVSGGQDNLLKAWEWESNQAPMTISQEEGFVTKVAFSPNGKYLASGGFGKVAKIWDWQTLIRSYTLTRSEGTYTTLSFSPNNRLLATSNGKTINVWDWQNQKIKYTHTSDIEGISDLAFSPDDKCIALSNHTGFSEIWNLGSHSSFSQLPKYDGILYRMAYLPDGELVAVGDESGNVKVWESKTQKYVRTPAGYENSSFIAVFSHDFKFIASGGGPFSKLIQIWNWQTNHAPFTLRTGHRGYFDKLAVSNDGRHLTSGSEDGSVEVWDLHTQRSLRFIENTAPIPNGGSMSNSIAFSPDGRLIVIGSDDGIVKIWDWQSQNHPYKLGEHLDSISSLAFSPDGQCIASGSRDGTVKIWNSMDTFLDKPNNTAAISLAKYYTNGVEGFDLQKVLASAKTNYSDLIRLITYYEDEDRRLQDYDLYHLNWCYEQLINLTNSESERNYLSEQKAKIEADLKDNLVSPT